MAPPGGTHPAGRGHNLSLPAIWNVPHPRNPYFTGRGDLLEALRGSGGETRPVVLTQVLRGLGGIGKTQLALEYAYRYGGTYRLVWWVRAEEPEVLASDYAALAQALQLPQHTAQDQPTIIVAVRQWLERHEGWLLILDNAPAPAAVQAYLPRSPYGHIVITSRHFGWGSMAKSLTVPVLPRQEAVQLLLEVTQQSDAETARAIAETLGDLPLAVAQAAAYMEATGLSLSTYVERLRTQREALLHRGEGSPDYPHTVATTWALAFEALRKTNPYAISLLRLCAFFAPDDIPHDLLRGHPSLLPDALDPLVADDLQWDDALQALRHYAFLEAGEDAFAIHRLVQVITRDRLSEQESTQWAAVAMQCVAALFPSGNAADDPRTWPTYARLFPHAASAVGHISHADPAKVDTTLLLQMGFYLERRAQFAEAKPYYERALAIREQVLGPLHPQTALSLNNLGALLRAQGDLAGAKPYFERALAIWEQVLGLQHPNTATSLNNLGALLRAQGDLAGAKSYYERAFHIFRLRLGQDHLYTDRTGKSGSLGSC